MKTIFLIRHAKSSWGNEQVPDHDRILNERGLRDAPLMGEKLKSLYMEPDKIICSTAQRADFQCYVDGQQANMQAAYEATQKKEAMLKALLDLRQRMLDKNLV